MYYVAEKVLKLAESVTTDHLVSMGTCFGKFTKSNKFRLHITALNYLAPYAQVLKFTKDLLNVLCFFLFSVKFGLNPLQSNSSYMAIT